MNTPQEENYTRYIVIGLALTIFMILSMAFYSLRESDRLAQAADHFTLERTARGAEIYREQCAACHGEQGEGGSGPALNNREVLKNTLDSVFFSVIRSGVPGTQMPAWSVDFGGPLTDEDVRDVVAFIRAWEPTAPEIQPEQFVPDPARGALLFSGTCAVCHGDGGRGAEDAPRINDPERLQALPDEWYRSVIRNGRPAKGMPTWGTVLSPAQIEDLVALIAAWREGEQVQPEFSVTELLESALFSLSQDDPQSAALQVERAIGATTGAAQEILHNAAAQLASGDAAGAQATLLALQEQWPLGDAPSGALVYSTNCAVCHGAQGEGGIGPALRDNDFIQTNTNADIRQLILDGRSGTAMAGFAGRLDDTQIANLIAFLRLWQGQQGQ